METGKILSIYLHQTAPAEIACIASTITLITCRITITG